MAKKSKEPNALRARDYWGTTFMGANNSLIAALMQSYFLLFLTDYAGLGSWAASLGTGVLVFARFFDAVNDPIEGFIMDRARPNKMGKFKPFIILSILLTTVGVLALFMIPSAVAESRVATMIWIVVFYLVYDVGLAFFAPELIYRGMTLDQAERAKLPIGPRMMNMAMGIICSGIVTVVNVINGSVNNLRLSFGLVVAALTLVAGVVSLIGVAPVKERYIPEQTEEAKIKIADIFLLFKENRPYRIRFTSSIFVGFIWTLMFAAITYYAKWAYCVDMTTGEVNQGLFGTLNLLISMMMFSPLILGTLIAVPMMKKFKSVISFYRFLLLFQAIPLGCMFLLHILGILQKSWVILLVLMVLPAVSMGAMFIPQNVLTIEVMDYDVWKNGKNRQALSIAVSKLLEKASSALSAASIGIVLTSVGYVVDSVTGNYLGDLANIPSMLTWFTVISGLAPCICGFVGWIILKKYPITNEIRVEMRAALQAQADKAHS